MRLVIHGIGSGFDLVRIWQDCDDPNRIPARVTIRSSTSDTTSLNAASFETALTSVSSLVFNGLGYVDIGVNAPANTQSLFLDFGGVDSLGQAYGIRVCRGSGIHGGRAVHGGGPDLRADHDTGL